MLVNYEPWRDSESESSDSFVWLAVMGAPHDKPDVVFVYQKHLNLIFRFSSCSGNKLIFFKTKRLTKRQNETKDQNLISKQDTCEQSSLFRLIQQQCILGVGSEYSFCVDILLLLFSHLFFSTKFKWIKSAGRTIKLFYLFLCKKCQIFVVSLFVTVKSAVFYFYPVLDVLC